MHGMTMHHASRQQLTKLAMTTDSTESPFSTMAGLSRSAAIADYLPIEATSMNSQLQSNQPDGFRSIVFGFRLTLKKALCRALFLPVKSNAYSKVIFMKDAQYVREALF
jgi:hypothetical protein